MAARIRKVVELRGVVQGVGFRPAVYRLARHAGLGGSVRNRSGTVELVLEGPAEDVAAFLRDLPDRLPHPARVASIEETETRPLPGGPPHAPFTIDGSRASVARHVAIPADLALCAACRREVLDPANRRYGYAFTTCTDCGPRYTVVRDMPYDRARTTLSSFPLCDTCRREYRDPADRRFHAESIACPACGPRLRLLDAAGAAVDGDPLRGARRALAAGRIVALRGIGGFLLAVDAANRDAVGRLRDRKRRPHKPLAVMARGLEAVRAVCDVPPAAEDLLRSAAAPIVILDLLPGEDRPPCPPGPACNLLAPDAPTLGVMLPASPLHLLLAEPLDGDPAAAFDWLVMTSGNRRGEPICLSLAEALERLGGIADVFLDHDRDIRLRNDDSLCILQRGAPQVWRRARGHAPLPIPVAPPLARTVLALGAELKNAVAVGGGGEVVLSPHVGDLETPEAIAGWRRVVEDLPRFLGAEPEAVAVDLHPDMHATRGGREMARALGLPLCAVQHHHAHAAACMAEHGLDDALALVFDGTGLGPDGTIWGAELLYVDPGGFRRLGTFAAAPLPGGDAAVREPVRQLFARWLALGLDVPADWCAAFGVSRGALAAWSHQVRTGLNAPLSHGAGRLFDAVSAALGIAPRAATYEGQPAVRLEAWARRAGPSRPGAPTAFRTAERDGLFVVDWSPLFARLAERPAARAPAPDAAAEARRFHDSVVEAGLAMAAHAAGRVGARAMVLSGGCFMNRVLTDGLVPRLEGLGFRVFLHRLSPPNDGCVALGQAAVAGRPPGGDAGRRGGGPPPQAGDDG